MVDEFFLLQEALDPLAGRVELLLCELGLARWLSALKCLELLISVEVLPGDPLHKLLVIDLTSHRNLEVAESFLSGFDSHGRVIELRESLILIVTSSLLHDV